MKMIRTDTILWRRGDFFNLLRDYCFYCFNSTKCIKRFYRECSLQIQHLFKKKCLYTNSQKNTLSAYQKTVKWKHKQFCTKFCITKICLRKLMVGFLLANNFQQALSYLSSIHSKYCIQRFTIQAITNSKCQNYRLLGDENPKNRLISKTHPTYL